MQCLAMMKAITRIEFMNAGAYGCVGTSEHPSGLHLPTWYYFALPGREEGAPHESIHSIIWRALQRLSVFVSQVSALHHVCAGHGTSCGVQYCHPIPFRPLLAMDFTPDSHLPLAPLWVSMLVDPSPYTCSFKIRSCEFFQLTHVYRLHTNKCYTQRRSPIANTAPISAKVVSGERPIYGSTHPTLKLLLDDALRNHFKSDLLSACIACL